MNREFIFKDQKSNKFWTINVNEKTCITHFGKLGTKGTQNVKTFLSINDCILYAENQIKEKLAKGYKEKVKLSDIEIRAKIDELKSLNEFNLIIESGEELLNLLDDKNARIEVYQIVRESYEEILSGIRSREHEEDLIATLGLSKEEAVKFYRTRLKKLENKFKNESGDKKLPSIILNELIQYFRNDSYLNEKEKNNIAILMDKTLLIKDNKTACSKILTLLLNRMEDSISNKKDLLKFIFDIVLNKVLVQIGELKDDTSYKRPLKELYLIQMINAAIKFNDKSIFDSVVKNYPKIPTIELLPYKMAIYSAMSNEKEKVIEYINSALSLGLEHSYLDAKPFESYKKEIMLCKSNYNKSW